MTDTLSPTEAEEFRARCTAFLEEHATGISLGGQPDPRGAIRMDHAKVFQGALAEAELAGLDDDEREEFLASLGLEEPGLNRLIRAGYALLDLLTYFTVGPKEARAWTRQLSCEVKNSCALAFCLRRRSSLS